jgi:glycosyltransferase involved in cell wall biosynthesis
MKILIVTDAWRPQINGVVRTLEETTKVLIAQGYEIEMLTPDRFRTFPLPSYPEIKLAWNIWRVASMIRQANADAIHIATPEGTIGLAARLYCVWNNIPYTSSYHTKLPEYIHLRFPIIPKSLLYAYMRWLHKDSKAVLVTTPTMLREMKERKFKPRLVVWNRGADFSVFKPTNRGGYIHAPKIYVYVGRVSVEKNIEAFLEIKTDARKVVVGDGPERIRLQAKYPDVVWLGSKDPQGCAEAFASADVFVFPSKTDTFGIVMIESTACGTPVAAYPVTGPIDFVREGINGSLNNDLGLAIEQALKVDRNRCYEYARDNYSWEQCTQTFIKTLAPIKKKAPKEGL